MFTIQFLKRTPVKIILLKRFVVTIPITPHLQTANHGFTEKKNTQTKNYLSLLLTCHPFCARSWSGTWCRSRSCTASCSRAPDRQTVSRWCRLDRCQCRPSVCYRTALWTRSWTPPSSTNRCCPPTRTPSFPPRPFHCPSACCCDSTTKYCSCDAWWPAFASVPHLRPSPSSAWWRLRRQWRRRKKWSGFGWADGGPGAWWCTPGSIPCGWSRWWSAAHSSAVDRQAAAAPSAPPLWDHNLERQQLDIGDIWQTDFVFHLYMCEIALDLC